MPIEVKKLPWAATWPGGGVSYSGENLIYEGNLKVSTSETPGYENPFLLTKKYLTGSWGFDMKPKPHTAQQFTVYGPSDFGNYVGGTVVSNPSWNSANLWARTNPTKPAVLLPVFWLELRDIPDMIRQAGRFLLAGRRPLNGLDQLIRRGSETRDLATANLAWQFGWAPLIGDLYRIATFQDHVDKRRREFQRATRAGGFRRRITIGGSAIEGTASRFTNFGNFTNFSTPIRWSSSSVQWAVLKWKPNNADGGLPSSDIALRAYLNGMHPSHVLANAWEALPWSWLIDYFTNIGDVIAAGNHTLLAPNGGSVMTQTTNVATHPPVYKTTIGLSAGNLRIVTKARSPVAGSALSGRIPSLEAGQLSILGSLATLRGRRFLGS